MYFPVLIQLLEEGDLEIRGKDLPWSAALLSLLRCWLEL
jgi:hypothetical protein